jgi:hypothetical protein
MVGIKTFVLTWSLVFFPVVLFSESHPVSCLEYGILYSKCVPDGMTYPNKNKCLLDGFKTPQAFCKKYGKGQTDVIPHSPPPVRCVVQESVKNCPVDPVACDIHGRGPWSGCDYCPCGNVCPPKYHWKQVFKSKKWDVPVSKIKNCQTTQTATLECGPQLTCRWVSAHQFRATSGMECKG